MFQTIKYKGWYIHIAYLDYLPGGVEYKVQTPDEENGLPAYRCRTYRQKTLLGAKRFITRITKLENKYKPKTNKHHATTK